MSIQSSAVNNVFFDTPEINLSKQGHFKLNISSNATNSDYFLVIDIYDLDNPVHPQGHIGWWQFPTNDLHEIVEGNILVNGDEVSCFLQNINSLNHWINEEKVDFKHLIVHAVLRSSITNAIIYQHKIPAFKKQKNINSFRASFNRDWSSPKFAVSSFIPRSESTVRIVSRNIFMKDAVGNLCLELYRSLRQNNIQVELYAENIDLPLNDFIRRVDQLAVEAVPADQLFYFSSTYDPYLDYILSIEFTKRIAYFHNITTPAMLQVFDPELSIVCRKAYEQVRLLEEFDIIASNSVASAKCLLSTFRKESGWKVKDIEVIPPRLLPLDILNNINIEKQITPSGTSAKLLYVGRIKSHKKIEDLLRLYAEYLKIDKSAELWIAGGGYDKAYHDYLIWTETKDLKIPAGKVKWFGVVSDDKLSELYSTANAYVCMSEHEGFCLPVFEAMLAGLPVFTYGLPAIREVLADTGIYFMDKDFAHLSKSIQSILVQPERVQVIIERQRKRASQIATEMDGKKLLSLLEA